jgi:hypothetical protein
MILMVWEIWDAADEEPLGAVIAATRTEAILIGISTFGRGVIYAVPADGEMEVA